MPFRRFQTSAGACNQAFSGAISRGRASRSSSRTKSGAGAYSVRAVGMCLVSELVSSLAISPVGRRDSRSGRSATCCRISKRRSHMTEQMQPFPCSQSCTIFFVIVRQRRRCHRSCLPVPTSLSISSTQKFTMMHCYPRIRYLFVQDCTLQEWSMS